MERIKTFKIKEIINDDRCVSSKNGEIVLNVVIRYINTNKNINKIIFDFDGINFICIDFLTSVIGGTFKFLSVNEDIECYVKVSNLHNEAKELLRESIRIFLDTYN